VKKNGAPGPAAPKAKRDDKTEIPTGPGEAGMDALARHEQRRQWFIAEASKQAQNRAMMARCEAFYDGEQYTAEDAQVLRDRGQNPVVYNEVKPTIDWMIGTERQARVDFVVIAEEDDEGASEDASVKTKLLKYLDDSNRAPFERSYAAEDMFKAGLGVLEVGLRGDKTGVPLFVGAVPWRDFLWDSSDRRRVLTNARYCFRVKVVDYDVALAIFPTKREQLDRCVQEGDSISVFSSWMGLNGGITGLDAFADGGESLEYGVSTPSDLFNPRKRVMLLECWSREPQRSPPGDDTLGDPVTFKVRVSIMTEHDTLIEEWSPFRHDQFPFVMLWAYMNRRTGLPYPPIYPLIGPQTSLNHRMSKSLMEASSNQIKVEHGAINDEAMTLADIRGELAAPDGVMVFADGALSGGRVQERPNGGAATAQLQLADRDILAIRGMSGVTGDSRGESTNVVSGKAVLAKQQQSGVLTAELFDNLLLGRQIEGELTLSIAEQHLQAPMTVRVTGDGNSVERTRINVPQADGTYLNDITARRAHFVVGEQAWKQAYAESAFDGMMELFMQMAPAAPQVVINLLDVLFDMHPNLPHKRAIVERIRSINGQSDPDGKVSPEKQAAMAEQQAKAKAEYDATMAKLQADIKEMVARGEKLDADAMKARLEALYVSAQAAQTLAQAPGATPIADELLRSAGFKDANGPDEVIPPEMGGQEPAPAQPQLVPGTSQPTMSPEIEQPGAALPEAEPPAPQLGDGQAAGIQTVAADGNG
jgi:hypothetical protein